MRKVLEPKQPAFLFYPADWLTDPQLSKCTPATRGIWMDILCAMHKNGRTGIMSGTMANLAQICRCSSDEMEKAIVELKALKAANVTFSTTKNPEVSIINRRMHRDYKRREMERLRKRRYRDSQHVPPLSRDRPDDVPPSSSCSYSIVSKKLSSSSSSWGGETGTSRTDFSDEFFDQIQAENSAVDVRFVFAKFRDWVSAHGGTGNRRHFLAWLKSERGSDAGIGGSAQQIARVLSRMFGDH